MARSYASVYLTIWSDPDFRELSWDAQWLYFVMLTHPTLTTCGVMDWRESRLANMADGVTVRSLREAAWQLGQRRLIAVDPDTEEALVRSFVRHDGTLKSPNLAKALVREYGGIASLKLMELVSIEVRRAVGENPDWKGCDLVEPITKQFTEPIRNPSELVPDWFHDGSESVPNRFENRSLKTAQKTWNLPIWFLPLTLTLTPYLKIRKGRTLTWSITERRAIAHERLRKKFQKVLSQIDFTPEQVEEFGPGIRPDIIRGIENKKAVKEMLRFPEDPDYDIRALQKSGLEDPWAMGLILPDDFNLRDYVQKVA